MVKRRGRCIIGTVLTDGAASLTASLEPSQLMAPVLSLWNVSYRKPPRIIVKNIFFDFLRALASNPIYFASWRLSVRQMF